jgi:hypothetical protein
MVSKNSISLRGDLIEFSLVDEFLSASITEHVFETEISFPYSKYVLYRIDIKTSIKNWSIWKRYSNFEEFREKMKKKIIYLPEFPEKKLFNTSKDIIVERKILLTNFLNIFLKKEKVVCFQEILDFIEADKDMINLLINKANLEQTSFSHKSKLSSSSKEISNDYINLSSNNYFTQYLEYKLTENSSKTAYMQLIEEFLKNLELKPLNKSSIIRIFDSFLKSKKEYPSFKTEEIYKLFFGETDPDTKEFIIRGLLAHIGSIEENEYGAEECLLFLLKLLNCEYNPDYEKYTSILKTVKKEDFEQMNLISHIKGEKTMIKSSVIKLIEIIYTENDSRITKLLEEAGLMKYYEKYIN